MPNHWKIADHRVFLSLIGLIILLGGLDGAILIYRSAGNNSTNDLIYEEKGGTVYPRKPEDSKKYFRDLELYGGRANVLVTEFRHWSVGLWQGKSVAFIIAFLAVFSSLRLFLFCQQLSLPK